MSGFIAGDLLIVKQSAILFCCGAAASITIADEPTIAVCLGEDSDRNTLKILMGSSKWLVKPKDCALYNNFILSRRKDEQNNNKVS